MRIVAGDLRGRRIVAPTGATTRPTSDRVREAIFSILGDLGVGSVLDLFAGSGAMGIEAISRGAASAVFVDNDPSAVQAIATNAAMVDAGRVRIIGRDWRAALRSLARDGERFDLCFVDAPYAELTGILPALSGELAPVLAPAARLVVEYSSRAESPELHGLAVRRRTDRTYGGTAIVVADMEISA